MTNKTLTEQLHEYIQNSDIVRSVITESVHRFYYDRILDKYTDKVLLNEEIGNVLSNLWNLQPDWRHVIKKHFERYEDAGKVTAVPLVNKPSKILPPLNISLSL